MSSVLRPGRVRTGFTVLDRPPLPHDGVDGDVWLQVPLVGLPVVPPASEWEYGSIRTTGDFPGENSPTHPTYPARLRTTGFMAYPERQLVFTWSEDGPAINAILVFYGAQATVEGGDFLGHTGWLEAPGSVITPPPGTVVARIVIALAPREENVIVELPGDIQSAALSFEEA